MERMNSTGDVDRRYSDSSIQLELQIDVFHLVCIIFHHFPYIDTTVKTKTIGYIIELNSETGRIFPDRESWKTET